MWPKESLFSVFKLICIWRLRNWFALVLKLRVIGFFLGPFFICYFWFLNSSYIDRRKSNSYIDRMYLVSLILFVMKRKKLNKLSILRYIWDSDPKFWLPKSNEPLQIDDPERLTWCREKRVDKGVKMKLAKLMVSSSLFILSFSSVFVFGWIIMP